MAITYNSATDIATVSTSSQASPDTLTGLVTAIANTAKAYQNNKSFIFNLAKIVIADDGWLKISDDENCDLQGNTQLVKGLGGGTVTGGIIHGYRSVLRYTGTSRGEDLPDTCFRSGFTVVCLRDLFGKNPSVYIDAMTGGTNRSDVFATRYLDASYPIYQIAGIDIYITAGCSTKLYGASGSVFNNIRLFNLGSHAATELQVNGGTYNDLYLSRMSTSSGTGAGNSRLVRPTIDFNGTASNLIFNFNNASAIIDFIDPSFPNGAFTGTLGGAYQGGLGTVRMYFTDQPTFLNGVSSVPGMTSRYKRSDGTLLSALTSDALGVNPSQELLLFTANNFSLTGSGYAPYTPPKFTWTLVSRKFDNQSPLDPILSAKLFSLPGRDSNQAPTRLGFTGTNSAASAITGVSFNVGTSIITVSGTRTLQEIFNYYCYWISLSANYDTVPFMTFDGITLVILGVWVLNVTGSITDITKKITGTITIGTGGVYEDSLGARWDVAGTTYFGNRLTLTVVDNATSSAIVGAIVASVDSSGVDRTYDMSRTQTGLVSDASGNVAGYAVWKIGATVYSSQKILVGQYAYQWAIFAKVLTGASITETERLVSDPFITLSKTAADAVVGITVVHSTKIVNMNSNSLLLSAHNLKSRRASLTAIDTGIPGYMSYYIVSTYSDTGILLRYDGSYYYGAYGWTFTNSGGGGILKTRDTGGVVTTYTSITFTNVVVGSQVYLYNTTGAALILNTTASTSTVSVNFTHTGVDQAFTFAIRKADYTPFEGVGTITQNGFQNVVAQVADAIYNQIGINGSTVTECSLSGGTIRIYINSGTAIVSGQRIYAWYKYILATSTYIALQPNDIVAQTASQFTFIGGLKIINQNVATPLAIIGCNIVDASNSPTAVLDVTNGASIAVNAAVPGVTLQTDERTYLFGVMTADQYLTLR